MSTHPTGPSRQGHPTSAHSPSTDGERAQRRLRMSHGMTTSTPLPSITDLLAPDEVARLLGVTTKTLANWRARSTGPDYVRVAGRIFYRRDAYLRYWQDQIEQAS